MKYTPNENQIKWGITAFGVIACAVILYFVIARADKVAAGLDTVAGILMPFIYGLVFAYLLCPLYNFIMRKCLTRLENKMKTKKRAMSISKCISTFVALVCFLVVVIGVVWLIVPDLVNSIISVGETLSDTVKDIQKWLANNADKLPAFQKTVVVWASDAGSNITEFIQKTLLPEYDNIASGIQAGVVGMLSFFKNFFVGIVICVYFLNSKEYFAAQSKKLILVLFKERRSEKLMNLARFTNLQFGKFINGKLIDSLIIGILCFIFMTIFGWDYALLISCIIGITNIIPFFGPFIGAIPSALLLAVVDPKEALYFIIFILILQQVDGNVIGPKILGETTGLSSFWVMFARLVGGGLFGFVGMILGLPIFAVIYAYATKGINKKLAEKGYSVDLNDYKVYQYHNPPDRKKKKNITI